MFFSVEKLNAIFGRELAPDEITYILEECFKATPISEIKSIFEKFMANIIKYQQSNDEEKESAELKKLYDFISFTGTYGATHNNSMQVALYRQQVINVLENKTQAHNIMNKYSS